MLKKLFYLLFALITMFLIGCKDESTEFKSDTPAMAVGNMDFLAFSDEVFFNDFEKLFAKDIDKNTIREKYELINHTGSSSATSATMVLVKYKNDKVLLVQVYYDSESDEYLINDVVEVPEDMVSFFENEFIYINQ